MKAPIECKQKGGTIVTSYTFDLGSVSLAMSDRHFNLTDRYFLMLCGLSLYHSRMELVFWEAGGYVQKEKGRVRISIFKPVPMSQSLKYIRYLIAGGISGDLVQLAIPPPLSSFNTRAFCITCERFSIQDVTTVRLLRASASMVSPFLGADFSPLTPSSQRKQLERSTRIANLPLSYRSAITQPDREILSKSIEALVQDVHRGLLKPIDILRTYGKVAIKAHEKTNCLTEVMIPEAESWAEHEVNLEGPLAGIPVSLKDSIAVKGFDVSVGYSCNTGNPYAEDGSLVKILKAAGPSDIIFFPMHPPRSSDYQLRSHSLRQNQSTHNSPLLRILERRLGPLPQST